MKLYITKDKSGLIQLWNNKPSYNKDTGIFYAWKEGKENIDNEIPVDVTNIENFNNLFLFINTPTCMCIGYIYYDLVTL